MTYPNITGNVISTLLARSTDILLIPTRAKPFCDEPTAKLTQYFWPTASRNHNAARHIRAPAPLCELIHYVQREVRHANSFSQLSALAHPSGSRHTCEHGLIST